MTDECLGMFLDRFGAPMAASPVPESALDAWRGKLPTRLLEYWVATGWGGFGSGLVWIVNPAAYEDLIDEWLEGTEFESLDAFHVIARSAFGDLFVCGERTGRSLTVACSIHTITGVRRELVPKSEIERNDSIESFFATASPRRFDLRSQDDGAPLFEAARVMLGDLDASTMYGFEPALLTGGRMALEGLRRVELDQHLTLLRQLAPPRIATV